jgi:hypothetical protein
LAAAAGLAASAARGCSVVAAVALYNETAGVRIEARHCGMRHSS